MDHARSVDARGWVDLVALAGIEVVRAMRWGSVDCAGALIGGNVVGVHAEDAAVKER